jgi:cytochrome c-type biogenesis protein
MIDLFQWIALPIGLGLLGFIEPCSVGSSLLFIKSVEGKSPKSQVIQIGIFALVRALVMGLLGLAAVGIGTAFMGFQKGAWFVFGTIYLIVGFFYLAGKSQAFSLSFGSMLSRFSNRKGSATLGALFAFNIPACAAPLIVVLLGMAAASGAGGASLLRGFVSMVLFGFALSLPLVVAALFSRPRQVLDRLASLSRRAPRITGAVLVILGLWSFWFGTFVTPA